MNETQLLNVQKAASFLGVSSATIRQWAQAGKLKGVKIGSRGDWRFTTDELSKMIHIEAETFLKIKKFLISHAKEIQRTSTIKHKAYLGSKNIRRKFHKEQARDHIKIIIHIAENLDNLEKGTIFFERFGEKLAKEAVEEKMTLEETVDGTIFLKQAFWELLEKNGFLFELTTQDLYSFNHIISTYTDILAAKLAFTFHNYYQNAQEEINSEKIRIGKTIQKQRYLAAIVSSSEDAIISKDLNGIIQSWNKSAEKLFGYKAKEAIGKPIYLIIPQDYRHEEDMIISNIKRGKRIEHFETVRRKKNGVLVEVSLSISPVKDSKGVIVGAAKIARDITQLKGYQQELEKIQMYYKRLFETDIIGIVFAGYKGSLFGKFIDANDYFLKLLGYTKKELQSGKVRWDTITPPEFIKQDQKALKELAETGECEPYEKEYISKSGKRIPIYLGIAVIPNTEYCIAYILDISERKQLESQKDDFLAIASHELKTPVTSLKAFAQVLENRFEKAGDKKTADLLKKMDIQIDKMTSLISDLLDVTKIHLGKLDYNMESFRLDLLIGEIIENVQTTAVKHKIITEGSVKKMVKGDKDRIGQVLTNLLTNAIKYSPDSDRVLVRIKSTKKHAVVTVKDFGIGINQEHQKRIFERFYRVSSSNEKTYPGLGIGLYISHEIIKRHGGKMSVGSKYKEGSEFSFTLQYA